MRRLLLTVVLACVASTVMPGQAKDTTQPINKADLELGFSHAFPRKFYEKKYFGVALTGATVVAAGCSPSTQAGPAPRRQQRG